MSLSRLALRLAACEALSPYAVLTTGPWPTIAGTFIYDSRIDLIQEDASLDEIEGKPILIVYTEEDMQDPYGTAKYPADEQIVHLVVEAMVATKGQVEIETEPGQVQQFGAVTAVISDREREALLDLLEGQVRRLLDTRNRAAGFELFNKVAWETHKVESYPQRAGDRVTRVAARTIKFITKVRKDVWPKVPFSPKVPFDNFPEPLATIAKALDPASSGGQLCANLVAQMSALRIDVGDPGDIFIVSPLDGDQISPTVNSFRTDPPRFPRPL